MLSAGLHFHFFDTASKVRVYNRKQNEVGSSLLPTPHHAKKYKSRSTKSKPNVYHAESPDIWRNCSRCIICVVAARNTKPDRFNRALDHDGRLEHFDIPENSQANESASA